MFNNISTSPVRHFFGTKKGLASDNAVGLRLILIYSFLFITTSSLYSFDCTPQDGYTFILVDEYQTTLTGCQEDSYTDNSVCNDLPGQSYYTTYDNFNYDPSASSPADRYTCTRITQVYDQTICDEVDPPEDLLSIKTYSGSGAITECNDDLSQIDQEQYTATCYVPQCATDPDVTLYADSNYANQDNDSDGDGLPNKCDPDYPAYDSLDCDSDGQPNGTDSSPTNDDCNYNDPNWSSYDCDKDGVPNGTDSDPSDSTSFNSCDPLPAETFLYDTSSANCNQSYLDSTLLNGSLKYHAFLFWDSCRDKCQYKMDYCPKGESIQYGECSLPIPNSNECSVEPYCTTLDIQIGGAENNSCERRCYCLDSPDDNPNPDTLILKTQVTCEDLEDDSNQNDNTSFDDHNSSASIEDFSENDDDPLADTNVTSNVIDAQSVKDALESYNVSKEETSLKQLDELKNQTNYLKDNRQLLKDIKDSSNNGFKSLKDKLKELNSNDNVRLQSLLSSTNSIDSKLLAIDNTIANSANSINSKLDELKTTVIESDLNLSNGIRSKLDELINTIENKDSNLSSSFNTKLDELISVVNDVNSKIDTNSSTGSNPQLDELIQTVKNSELNSTDRITSKLDELIGAVNGVDTNSSSFAGVTGSSLTKDDLSDINTSGGASYNGSSVSDLEDSLTTFEQLQDDFTSFNDNLLNDIQTVGDSFSNAEDLFKNGNLALSSVAEVSSCPESMTVYGQYHEIDLCQTVSPYSNVIYSFVYIIGFFSILITFAYIFVLKGVD